MNMLTPRTFLTHYLAMLAAMAVGMVALDPVWHVVWPAYAARVETMAATMAVDMSVAMAVWMRFRGHAARGIGVMCAAMLAPVAAVLAAYEGGLVAPGAVLTWSHLLMLPAMAAAMLVTGTGSPGARSGRVPARPRSAPPAGARAATALIVAGTALGVVSSLLHPHHENPNNHVAVFAEYAASRDWEVVHDLQYLAAALVTAGFVAVYHAVSRSGPTLLGRLGLAAATVTTALIGVNMAVDGVALRHAVDAWVAASPAERSERFAAAEAVRWIEWGANSLFLLQLGVTVLLFSVLLARRGRRQAVPAVAGLAAGVLLIVNGYQVGAVGFAPTRLPLLVAALFLVLAVGPWRLSRDPGQEVGSAVPDRPEVLRRWS